MSDIFTEGPLLSFPIGNTRVIDCHIIDLTGADVDVSSLTTTGIQAFIKDETWTAAKTYAIGTGITVGSGATNSHAYVTIAAADTGGSTSMQRGFSGHLEIVITIAGVVESYRRPLALQ